jgi:hypothetical protein
MLTKIQKDGLDKAVSRICAGYSDSGGDWSISELLDSEAKDNWMTREEVEYVRMRLIKRIHSYEG